MKFVYILEDDSKFQKEMCEAISFIDPKIQIRLFPTLESFADWMRQMMTNGPAAIALGGQSQNFVPQEPVSEDETHQLTLVISKVEFLGAEQLDLLRKTRKIFVERKICTAEDPTAFVLTAFDNPNFQIRDLEDRILNNVIFKPFDRLILVQHLTFAIDGRHPPSKYTVANQKTTALVEMLKDIEIEDLSDVGFVTKSYREIPLGIVAKYYGEIFRSDRQRSLFAVSRSCVPHPKDPKSFQCSFTFFAADQTQVSTVRRKVRAKDTTPSTYAWLPPTVSVASPLAPPIPASEAHIVMMDEEEESPSGLLGYLQKGFKNTHVNSYHSFANFLSDLDPASAIQQRDPGLKTLGGATTVILKFDASGATYLDFESDKKDLTVLFGVPLTEWKKKSNWLGHAILAEHRERYRKIVQSGKVEGDNLFPLSVNEIPFWVKITNVSKEHGQVQITLIEPVKEEQIAWLQKNSKLQKPVDLIIANHRLFGEGAKERWTYIKEALKKRFDVEPKIVMTTKRDFTDAEERSIGSVIDDIFFKPVDRVYFLQKVKCFLPQFQEKAEKIEIKGIAIDQIIKVANPVTITEISEAGLVMQYYRPIQVGSFREMVLWQPYEIGAPELLATCNFVEESTVEKGSFNCHFVFYGITDHYLKVIRVWIRDNYVLSKEGQAA